MGSVFRGMAAVVTLAASFGAHAIAAEWTVVDLTPEGAGSASAVSEGGIVVGCRHLGNNVQQAYVYRNGQRSDLATPPGSSSCASAVNDGGLVAGQIDNEVTVWQNGVARRLGVEGYVTDVSESGILVGGIANGTNALGFPSSRAVIWVDGVLTELGLTGHAFGINRVGQIGVITDAGELYMVENGAARSLGAKVTTARGLNDRGEIVGMTSFGHGPEPYIYDGVVHQIPAGGSYAGAVGLNNRGQILGSGEGVYGYLIEAGATRSIDSMAGAPFHHSEPSAINDRGWIVGRAGSADFHAFLLMPKEASTPAASGNPAARASTRATPIIRAARGAP